MGWIWSLVLVVTSFLVQIQCRPDFGLPASIPESGNVVAYANYLGNTLNEVLIPFRRIPTNLYSEELRQASASISQLVLNVTEHGASLATVYSKAAYERKVPVGDVFESLYEPYRNLEHFLIDLSPEHVSNLAEHLGIVSSNEFKLALQTMREASMNSYKALQDLELSVNSTLREANDASVSLPSVIYSEPNSASRELAKSLLSWREQVRPFINAVDSSVKSIEMANSHLDNIQSMKRSASSSLDSSLAYLLPLVKTENDQALSKYKTTHRSIQTDLAAAVKRLSIFAVNKTLASLTNAQTEAFTKSYYDMYHRYEADTTAINNCYGLIRSSITSHFQTIAEEFFAKVHTTSDVLVKAILARGAHVDQCNGKYKQKITGTFQPLQNEVRSCVTRERSRLPRITEAIDKLMQLVQSNSVDFSTDIGNCGRFANFATNDDEYSEAKACLESNLGEMGKFDELIGTELDTMKPLLAMEAASSAFRSKHCISQSLTELKALMEGTKLALSECVINGP